LIIFGITKYVNKSFPYTAKYIDGINWQGEKSIKTRKLALGERNLVGARVTEARLRQGMKQNELLARLQLAGIEISIPALSLLEGQKRPVSDIELVALSKVLNVSVEWLLGIDSEKQS